MKHPHHLLLPTVACVALVSAACGGSDTGSVRLISVEPISENRLAVQYYGEPGAAFVRAEIQDRADSTVVRIFKRVEDRDETDRPVGCLILRLPQGIKASPPYLGVRGTSEITASSRTYRLRPAIVMQGSGRNGLSKCPEEPARRLG